MTADADCWADTCRKGHRPVVFSNGVVQLTYGSTCLNPCSAVSFVDSDGTEASKVDDDERIAGRDVGHGFIVMTAATDTYTKAGQTAACDGGLHIGEGGGGDDEGWFYGGVRGDETSVLDGGKEDVGVGACVWCVDVSGGVGLVYEALEEF